MLLYLKREKKGLINNDHKKNETLIENRTNN